MNKQDTAKRTFLRQGKFFVYMVQCVNGMYYTGSTNNLERRLKEHNSGKGAKYLRGKGPVKLVYCKEYRNYMNVVRAERKIKKFLRKQKDELVRIYAKSN